MAPKYERLAQGGEDEEDSVELHQRQDPLRPFAYSGDGPFDAPSSDEEDDAALLEKTGPPSPGLNGEIEELQLRVGGPLKKSRSARYLAACLAALVLLAVCIGALAALSYSGTIYHAPGVRHITMDHVFNGTFYAQRQGIRWVPEAGDGVFAISQNNYVRLVDLKTNTTKNLVAMQNVRDRQGNPLHYSEWKLSPDMKYLLVKADYRKQWRHSSFGNYYVHNLEDHSTHPLIPPTYPPETAYATWSPTGESIAFVNNNDLYVVTSPDRFSEPIRITTSGNASLFHGVPDWVYEEEVFSSDYALWWSPDSTKVAFLRFDETAVDEFAYPVYNPTNNAYQVVPYTSEVVMKYPKPGYNNPLVSVHVFDLGTYEAVAMPVEDAMSTLDWTGRQPVENSVIQEITWVGNSTLILKEVNRAADNGSVVYFDLSQADVTRYSRGEVVRRLGKDGEEGDGGWIEASQLIYPVPGSDNGAYLDIVPTKDGYNHIALFNPGSSSTPQFLTTGEWEVTGGIKSIDTSLGVVYFQAATPSTQRHIYSVPIPDLTGAKISAVKPAEITDRASAAWYNADFSPKGGFYLLSYDGPSIPWQRIVKGDDESFDYVLTDNARLNETLWEYEAPIRAWSTLEIDGYEMNALEIRPPRMDDSGRTKYPVLFRVYGGPGSQLVDNRFARDWHDYLACSLKYIVVVVDGRGTGFKGRDFRNFVRNDLGFWETRDQISAAKIWAAKPYVDPKRIGIWGWSYGGFMSSKVVEADGGVHSLAMAVAPVTSWRLYDSIYTERYMDLPSVNAGGYVNASISNVTAFNNVDFLLAHGSGDDNVHFANSAHLLDMFTQARIRGFRFRMFTDSDHGIQTRGAYRELHEFLTGFLEEKWGKGPRRRTW